jgi:hypothetical protein
MGAIEWFLFPFSMGSAGEPEGTQPTTSISTNTTVLLNFDGIGENSDWIAPDSNGAAGATQFVEWPNVEYTVYDKTTGAAILGPLEGDTLWSGFGGNCETKNSGDPIVTYDKLAGRWVFTQHTTPAGETPYQCVAVSTTSDATGSYYRYAFALPLGLPDYPKLGVWPDAYYLSINQAVNNVLIGAYVCALDRTAMLAGLTATAQCFQEASSVVSLLPSDLDGTTPPPAGEANIFIDLGVNALEQYQFHVNFANPTETTFTGPTAIAVTPFTQACGDNEECVPQLGTSNKLTTLGDRLMYRLAYRNYGSYQSFVVNHAILLGGGKTIGVRWYELRATTSKPTVYQSGTFDSSGVAQFMGSIAEDKMGDIAMGFTASSGAMYPQAAYTGRLVTDPLNTMELQATIVAGGGSQTTSYRWGDYSSMAIDPTDDCTFWYATQYLKTSGTKNWSTRLFSFKFNTCN